MSRRHHHTGREPRTEQMKLDPLGESLLDALEVEIRARRAYELAEQATVAELNLDRRTTGVEVDPIPWAETDPDTRRDYRRHVIYVMHRAGQLVGEQDKRAEADKVGEAALKLLGYGL